MMVLWGSILCWLTMGLLKHEPSEPIELFLSTPGMPGLIGEHSPFIASEEGFSDCRCLGVTYLSVAGLMTVGSLLLLLLMLLI